MIIRIGMAPRLEGTTPEQFQAHWRTAHAEAAGAIPGIRSYVQNHAVLLDGWPLLPYPGFDACAEIAFDDLDAHDEGFVSPYYQGDVRADEDRFVDKARFSWVLTEPVELLDRGAATQAVKLLTLWRAHPVAGQSGLLEGVAAWAEAVRADPLVRRHRQLRVRHDWHEGRDPAACDHVDVLWFDSVDDARAHLAGPAQEAAHGMAGRAFGQVAHLAVPRRIV